LPRTTSPLARDIFNDAWSDLHRRYGFEEDASSQGDDSWLTKPLAHFLESDPGGGLLALDDDGPVAFASSARRDDFWCLSYLFVRPRGQDRGVGRDLLRRLLPHDNAVVRSCKVESFQTVATSL
jgi:GNAT superfamily N-acetyltransferase